MNIANKSSKIALGTSFLIIFVLGCINSGDDDDTEVESSWGILGLKTDSSDEEYLDWSDSFYVNGRITPANSGTYKIQFLISETRYMDSSTKEIEDGYLLYEEEVEIEKDEKYEYNHSVSVPISYTDYSSNKKSYDINKGVDKTGGLFYIGFSVSESNTYRSMYVYLSISKV